MTCQFITIWVWWISQGHSRFVKYVSRCIEPGQAVELAHQMVTKTAWRRRNSRERKRCTQRQAAAHSSRWLSTVCSIMFFHKLKVSNWTFWRLCRAATATLSWCAASPDYVTGYSRASPFQPFNLRQVTIGPEHITYSLNVTIMCAGYRNEPCLHRARHLYICR